MDIVVFDPRARLAAGTELTPEESTRYRAVKTLAAVSANPANLHWGPNSGFAVAALGKGRHYTGNRAERSAQVLVAVKPGQAKINWTAVVVPINANLQYSGSFRLINEPGQHVIAAGLDAVIRPDAFKSHHDAGPALMIEGQSQTSISIQGHMALSLYGIADNCNVIAFGVGIE